MSPSNPSSPSSPSSTGVRIGATVIGLALLLIGATFFLQGLGILKGSSFMVGDARWAVIGGGLVVGSLLLIRWART